jgi:hypothetical protein
MSEYPSIQQTNSAQDVRVQNRYKGVRGWLLFFCVGLTVLTPLYTMANLASGYSAVSKVADRLPGLMMAIMLDIIMGVIIMAFSILAGVFLWSVRPGAVKVTKAYLITLCLYSVLEISIFMAALPKGASDKFVSSATSGLLRTLFYAGIWFLYLIRSKRVRATYFDADDGDFVSLNLGPRPGASPAAAAGAEEGDR